NYEYRYIYNEYDRLISRHKIYFYTNLLYIDEVIRFRYKKTRLIKVSKYNNLTIPFQRKKAKDKHFRETYHSYYDYNSEGLISRIKYEVFKYRNDSTNTAFESIKRETTYEYTKDNNIKIITEKLNDALNRVMHYYYDKHNNLIKKERIIYYDVTKNENITYEYRNNGKGPLKRIIRESFVKKEKIIEYYISENHIEKLEMYNSDNKIIGIFKFNYSGDIIEEVKYGIEEEYYTYYEYYQYYQYYIHYEEYEDFIRVAYEYYDNSCVYSATIYNSEGKIRKRFYFTENVPYLYGEINRIDFYNNGELFVSHFYFMGKKIKSIFYKDGEVHYVDTNPED
ncbi:MAG: hypothetical protein ACOCV8_00415, partial [Spirochaetota bacterium]